MNSLRNYINTVTDFSDESWQVLQSFITPMHLKRNECLLREGEVCNAVYFIVKGFCKASHWVDGKEINTAFFKEHDFVTNIKSLRQQVPSGYDIKACEVMDVIRLDKQKLLQAYQVSPQIETFGRKILELMVSKQEEEADTFRLLSPKQRYEQFTKSYPDLLQRVSLTQLASYLGMSRETLSRIRAQR